MLKFEATDEQIKAVAALAVNASTPMGLGFLHATNREFKSSDFDLELVGSPRGLRLDYVQGRMVKLSLMEVDPGVWKTYDDNPRADYQSWSRTYPTTQELLAKAGITSLLNGDTSEPANSEK